MALKEKSSLSGLNPGDYVWCKYVASSNTLGTFSDLGVEMGWIDGGMPTGLNYDTTKSVKEICAIEYNSKLYVVWCENNASSVPIVKAKSYDGISWTNLNSGLALNYDDTKYCAYPCMAIMGGNLYVAWCESGGSYTQIRVKAFNGTVWSWVDGGGALGLNYSPTTKDVYYPAMTTMGSNLYLFWDERASSSTIEQIRGRKYDGTAWTSIDGNGTFGLNYSSTVAARRPSVAVYNNELYVSWSEGVDSPSRSVRVKKYDGSTWNWVDGGGASGLRYDNTGTKDMEYTREFPLVVCNGYLYSIWIEVGTTYRQVRVKKYNGTTWSWADGGGVNGINYNTGANVYVITACVANNELYVLMREQNASNYQLHCKKYNETTWVTMDSATTVGLNVNYTANTVWNYQAAVSYNNIAYGLWVETAWTLGDQLRVRKIVNREFKTIAINGTTSPNGYFKFICVGTDYMGRKKLVADRNIQTGIAWTTLNNAGVALNNGLLFSDYVKETVSTTAASSNKATYLPSKAVDGVVGSYDANMWISGDGTMSGGVATTDTWLQFNYASPKIIRKFAIVCYDQYAIKDFKIQGLVGSNWVDIGTYVGIGAGKTECVVETSTAYTSYRIYILSVHNAAYNAAGIVEVEGYSNLYTTDFNFTKSIRLLSGGLSATDIDNEWDKILVGSTLGGNITAGDTAIWNTAVAASWTSTVSPTSTSYRVLRGRTTTGVWLGNDATYNPHTSTNDTYNGFRPMLLLDELITVYYLIKDGNDIKKYVVPTGWTTVGTGTPTQAQYINGMLTMSDAFSNIGSLTSANPEVLAWSDTKTAVNVTEGKIIPAKLVAQNSDISINSVEHIDSFTLTTTGTVRVIASFDSGVVWKTWNGSAWVTIDANNLTTVKADGMTTAVFNAITMTNWAPALANGTVRFAYYLETTNINNQASIDSLASQFDMLGSWSKASASDARYGYVTNTLIEIVINASGDYKINY